MVLGGAQRTVVAPAAARTANAVHEPGPRLALRDDELDGRGTGEPEDDRGAIADAVAVGADRQR